MLSPTEKVKTILAILGDQSKNILSHLSPASAQTLASSMEDTPATDTSTKNQIVQEVLNRYESLQQSQFSGGNEEESSGDSFDFSDSSFDSDDSSSDDFSNETPGDVEELEPVEEVVEVPTGPRLRSNTEIAAILSKQKPQVAAFVLSHLDDKVREDILGNMSPELVGKIQERKVEDVPLSEAVYSELYELLFKKGDQENSDPDKEEESDLVQTYTIDGRVLTDKNDEESDQDENLDTNSNENKTETAQSEEQGFDFGSLGQYNSQTEELVL